MGMVEVGPWSLSSVYDTGSLLVSTTGRTLAVYTLTPFYTGIVDVETGLIYSSVDHVDRVCWEYREWHTTFPMTLSAESHTDSNDNPTGHV